MIQLWEVTASNPSPFLHHTKGGSLLDAYRYLVLGVSHFSNVKRRHGRFSNNNIVGYQHCVLVIQLYVVLLYMPYYYDI